MTWTTAADAKHQVQRWWDRGELLSSLVTGESSFPRRLRLKEPTSGEMTDRFDDVRAWISELRRVPHCRLELREFKHRVFGTNNLPSEIWIDTLDDALAMIGKRREASRFAVLLQTTRERQPRLLSWIARKPLRALELYDAWERLLRVTSWLEANPRPGIYVRQVDIAGIDSKFIETHRGVLSELLDLVLPADAIDNSVGGVGQFACRYGFRDKPVRIRFRILDPARALVPPDGLQDVTLDGETFAQLSPDISRVFITENEINFLCFGQLESSMVVFGSGYGFDVLAQARWLHACQLHYWGDIDTHGFAILNSARAHFPHIRSLLMDEATLLAHSEKWGEEPSQHSADSLQHLTAEEQSTYRNLKLHTWRRNIRLEQERIPWGHAWDAISRNLVS